MSPDIKKTVLKTVKKCGTNDPFHIAERLGYLVLFVTLNGIRGFHQYIKRTHIIYINEDLPEPEKMWVCAHELGHALLHEGMNRIYLSQRTLLPSGRYETEANRFAVCLLYPAQQLLSEYEGCSSHQISSSLGIPAELVEYSLIQ